MDLRCLAHIDRTLHDEALAVRADAIVRVVRAFHDGPEGPRGREDGRYAELEPRRAASDRDRHQSSVEAQVEELLPVTPPAGLCPAVGRDAQRFPPAAERLDVDLEAPRLRRDVGEPTAVGGDVRLVDLEALHERLGRPTAVHGERPERALLAERQVEQCVALTDPLLRDVPLLGLLPDAARQRCCRLVALQVQAKQVLVAARIRRENELVAVRGPYGITLVAGIGRQARRHAAGDVDRPEVEWALSVCNLRRDTLAVRREDDLPVAARITDRADAPPRTIDPLEPGVCSRAGQPGHPARVGRREPAPFADLAEGRDRRGDRDGLARGDELPRVERLRYE